MCVELNGTETVLLFGGPVAAIRERDGSIRLNLRRDDFGASARVEWVVYAELADMKVAVDPSDAAALARRVMARPTDDGLLVSESLILDRRAEVLAEAAHDCGDGKEIISSSLMKESGFVEICREPSEVFK